MTHHNHTTIKTSQPMPYCSPVSENRAFLLQLRREKRDRSLGYRQHWSFFNEKVVFVSFFVLFWSVKRGTAVVGQKEEEECFVERIKTNKTTAAQPALLLSESWLDSNTEHRGWSFQTLLVRLRRSAVEFSGSQELVPPIWEVNKRGWGG